jgi:hypothetical protein
MGELATSHELVWKMRLAEDGYTVLELTDTKDRRWGWVVNASRTDWTAHVGSFGQAELPVRVEDEVKSFPNLGDAREWVEESIAALWTFEGR